MKQAGLGGATVVFLAGPHHHCDTPEGPVRHISPAWLDLMTHNAAECERLGLGFGMHNCAGWASTGGPWITQEPAMQQLVSADSGLASRLRIRARCFMDDIGFHGRSGAPASGLLVIRPMPRPCLPTAL